MPTVTIDYTTNIDGMLVAEVKLDETVVIRIVQGDNEQTADIQRMADNALTVAQAVVQAMGKQPPV